MNRGLIVLACCVFPFAVHAAQAQQAIAMQMARPGAVPVRVPREVDRTKNLERLVVLASHGPIVIDLKISVDGKPYQTYREELIDEVLKLADSDGDGKPTWKEAEANKRIGAYRASADVGNPFLRGMMARRQPLVDLYDKNKDTRIDRYEARLFLATEAGVVLGLGSANPYYGNQTAGSLWALFDRDKDGKLSAEEMDAVPGRIRKRDADDDEAVNLSELLATPAGNAVDALVSNLRLGNQPTAPSQDAFLLGPTADLDALHKEYTQRYGAIPTRDKDKLRQQARLLADALDHLDKNKNDKIDKDEWQGLNAMKPHLVLDWQLQANGKASIRIERLGAKEGPPAPFERQVIGVFGAQLNLNPAGSNSRVGFQVSGLSGRAFNDLDVDKNGVIDAADLAKNPNVRNLAALFNAWDLDSDKKVTRKEHAEFQERQRAAGRGRVVLDCRQTGHRLFAALDVDGDNQLGLREVRGASKRLKGMDKDGDGKLTRAELPPAGINLGLEAKPSSVGQNVFFVAGAPSLPGPRPRPARGPLWFRKMDQNGDGDVSRREFLGATKDFDKLDRNGDDFIDADEAERAKN